MCRADPFEHGVTHQTRAAERRIGHDRYAAPRAPRHEIALDAAGGDVVENLIGRAAIAARNTEEFFHITDVEIRHAPGAYLFGGAKIFESRNDAGEIDEPAPPVQQVKIEMVGAETGKACVAS